MMTTHGAKMTHQQGWRGVVRFVSAFVTRPVPSARVTSLAITRNDAKCEPSGLRGDPA